MIYLVSKHNKFTHYLNGSKKMPFYNRRNKYFSVNRWYTYKYYFGLLKKVHHLFWDNNNLYKKIKEKKKRKKTSKR